MAKAKERSNMETKTVFDVIQAGDRVTIEARFGKEATGTAVFKSAYGWALNMGGKHGTPGVATRENTLRVYRKSLSRK